MMKKQILVTGGTGLIGKKIINELCREGAYVKLLTTNVEKAKSVFEKNYTVEALKWSLHDNPMSLKDVMEDTDAIINLAGASVAGKRWNKKYKNVLYDSRINTTKLLVDTIRVCKNRPKTFISASATGIYGFRGDELLNENSSLGKDFLAELCRDWENEAMKAIEFDIRVVMIRTGIVLDKKDGALKEIMTPFKFFAGGKLGSGNQWYSWIHIDDIMRLYLFALENEMLLGPVNGTSPKPVTNKIFSKTLGNVINRPSVFPVPAFALKILLGEFAQNLITGQRVLPEKSVKAKFEFKFPELKEALTDLLKNP
ncbi:MAG: TIGR01777 family oxidoreductase [Ignavibacteria bacterium]